jgi:multiple sugar transport system substrate-binding protein
MRTLSTRNLRRSRLVAGTLATIAALALVGCGSGSGSASGGTTTLTMLAADYGSGPANTSLKYWDGLAARFHQQNPDITIEMQVVAWTDFDTELQTMVEDRAYPDVTEGDYFNEYAQDGILYPASEVFSDVSNLLPSFLKLGQYNGTQYGMPFTTSAQTLFYNKKLFAQAGIAHPPATWAEVEADAAKIKALGKVGLGLPLGPEATQGEAFMWFLSNGGGFKNAAGNWAINSPQNIQAFQFLTSLVKQGLTEPDPATTNRTEVWQQFAEGNVGFVDDGQGALIPIIQKAGVLTGSDWGTAPLVGRNAALNTTMGVADQISAFKTGPDKAAAIKKWLDFVYENANQLAFSREYDLLPATISASDTLATDPVFGGFIKALPNAQLAPSDPAWIAVKGPLQNTIGLAVLQNPASILDKLQQIVTQAASNG